MPRLLSKYFGKLDYSPEAVSRFPVGIPGFESQTEFVFLEQSHTNPLVFIQSLSDPGLCFIAAPVYVADPAYRLDLAPEDLAFLELSEERAPTIGTEVLCLGLVTVSEGADPTINLAAPVVVNLKTRKGIQAIQTSSAYSYRHRLLAQEDVVPCS